jgi:hypothetical protein
MSKHDWRWLVYFSPRDNNCNGVILLGQFGWFLVGLWHQNKGDVEFYRRIPSGAVWGTLAVSKLRENVVTVARSDCNFGLSLLHYVPESKFHSYEKHTRYSFYSEWPMFTRDEEMNLMEYVSYNKCSKDKLCEEQHWLRRGHSCSDTYLSHFQFFRKENWLMKSPRCLCVPVSTFEAVDRYSWSLMYMLYHWRPSQRLRPTFYFLAISNNGMT